MAEKWSKFEVKEIVADYFDMLLLELQGVKFNKSAHRRSLQEKLNNRSHGSIEKKHQNISAALIEMGFPYISGYKPLRNFQRTLLPNIIDNHLLDNPKILDVVSVDVEKIVEVPTVAQILQALVTPPKKNENQKIVAEPPAIYSAKPVNYLAKEAYNRALGKCGEQFVLNFEQARLNYMGCKNLADRIEHVSITKGDSVGFDIHSYEKNGSDRFIEVKTTKYGRETPFFVSSNELRFSKSKRNQYFLYRVFDFRINPKLFNISGYLIDNFNLSPTEYIAKI